MKNITVITKNFGENFTGATKATCTYLEMLEDKFDRVEVFCLHTGNHRLRKGVIHRHANILSLSAAVRKAARQQPNTVYLSDDHFGFILRFAGVPYIHMYHGNWPQAMTISPGMFLKSFYFMPLYALTILFARKVAHVSFFMEHSWRLWNSHSVIIRNGIRVLLPEAIPSKADTITRIIMVGNIDKRKYGLAPRLFDLLEKNMLSSQLQIDIYGNSLDAALEKKLRQYSFVDVKGYQPDFSFHAYDLFLSLSSGENLSIAICEALGSATPVFCFNVGGLIEVVRNGENGFLLPKGRVKEMANILGNVVRTHHRFIFQEHALEDFSWQLSADRLYRTLTGVSS